MYMRTLEDLRLAIRTAYLHCKTGRMVLLAPDSTRLCSSRFMISVRVIRRACPAT